MKRFAITHQTYAPKSYQLRQKSFHPELKQTNHTTVLSAEEPVYLISDLRPSQQRLTSGVWGESCLGWLGWLALIVFWHRFLITLAARLTAADRSKIASRWTLNIIVFWTSKSQLGCRPRGWNDCDLVRLSDLKQIWVCPSDRSWSWIVLCFLDLSLFFVWLVVNIWACRFCCFVVTDLGLLFIARSSWSGYAVCCLVVMIRVCWLLLCCHNVGLLFGAWLSRSGLVLRCSEVTIRVFCLLLGCHDLGLLFVAWLSLILVCCLLLGCHDPGLLFVALSSWFGFAVRCLVVMTWVCCLLSGCHWSWFVVCCFVVTIWICCLSSWLTWSGSTCLHDSRGWQR